MATTSPINITEATRVIASGNLHEMSAFFLHSSPQKEILLQKLRRACDYFDEPLDCLSVSDLRIIKDTPVMLCSGYSHSGLGLPFGFFILGVVQDVFIPYRGAGFVGTRLCSEIFDNGDADDSARDDFRETDEFGCIVMAYAVPTEKQAHFHAKMKDFPTTYEFRSELISLLPARGVDHEVMWQELKERVVF
jgi:hypothetical protein